MKGCVTVRCEARAKMLQEVASRSLMLQGGIRQASVVILILGGYAQTSHTPNPSPEGRFRHLFLVGNGEVMWGDLKYYFLFDNK